MDTWWSLTSGDLAEDLYFGGTLMLLRLWGFTALLGEGVAEEFLQIWCFGRDEVGPMTTHLCHYWQSPTLASTIVGT